MPEPSTEKKHYSRSHGTLCSGPSCLMSSVIWGRKLNFCEPRFCLLSSGNGPAWLSDSCCLQHSLGLMSRSEKDWGCLLKPERTLCKREPLIIIPHTNGVLSPVGAESHLLPDNSGPDVVNICLLRWAFYRERRKKGVREDRIPETVDRFP